MSYSQMDFIAAMAVSMLLGFIGGEILYRRDREKWRRECERVQRQDRVAQLKAEYLDKQLWQFISLDEWLDKSTELDKEPTR